MKKNMSKERNLEGPRAWTGFTFGEGNLLDFSVYGPRQRPDMAFHRFCKAVIDHEPIRIYGDGYQTRDYTYVSDVVEATVSSATASGAVGEIMNIAGGSRTTVHDAVQILRDVAGSPINIAFEEIQHGDVSDTFADTSRAQQVIGYHPRRTLTEGLINEFESMLSLYTTLHRAPSNRIDPKVRLKTYSDFNTGNRRLFHLPRHI